MSYRFVKAVAADGRTWVLRPWRTDGLRAFTRGVALDRTVPACTDLESLADALMRAHGLTAVRVLVGGALAFERCSVEVDEPEARTDLSGATWTPTALDDEDTEPGLP